MSRIYPHIYIDEVQDLAGYDLDILKLLLQSQSELLMVGDPRQVTYLTHYEKRYERYRDGLIKQFIIDEQLACAIDETTLKKSHRNNAVICAFSSELFPSMPQTEPCTCAICRAASPVHAGIFLVKESDVAKYRELYRPVILRQQKAKEGEWTFGMSKGLGFDRILIYPTTPILNYLKDGKLTKTVYVKGKKQTKSAFEIAKFYVALTRGRYSVAIVCNFKNEQFIDGIKKWNVISSNQSTLFE